jgi:two-component system cell cycle sensor histidine kinase/response regulator CckA
VELVTEQEHAPRIRIDPAQLEQVLLNLTVNAGDAMPQGGRLSIRTEAVELGPHHPLRPPHLAPGEYAMLTLRDTGVGMDAETRQRVFEPFFTTKGAGRGTGLGLFTVYGIVRQSGGHVSVESEPGAGATFRVLFPHAEVEAAVESGSPREELARGRETVLLAEDELPVRLMVQRFLERLGYQVLAAPDGEAALQLNAAHPREIHLLLTDMTMPRMSGRELALRLAETRPRTRIIIMSGYTEEELPPTPAGSAPIRFVHKPFSLSVLANALRDVLDTEVEVEARSA